MKSPEITQTSKVLESLAPPRQGPLPVEPWDQASDLEDLEEASDLAREDLHRKVAMAVCAWAEAPAEMTGPMVYIPALKMLRTGGMVCYCFTNTDREEQPSLRHTHVLNLVRKYSFDMVLR